MRVLGRGFLEYWGRARQALVPDHHDSRAVRRMAREMRAADRAADRMDELIGRAGATVADALREATVAMRDKPDAYGRWRVVVILPGRTGFLWTGRLAFERDRLATIYGLDWDAAAAAALFLRDRVRGCT